MRFERDKEAYTNEERLELAELVNKYKQEYDAECEANKGKTKWDSRRKKHVPIKPKRGFVARAVREFYSDLAKKKNKDKVFNRAIKVAERAHANLDKLKDPSLHPAKRKRSVGGGRKAQAPEVREEMFAWFVDIRESLKGRLPRKLFQLKARSVYEDWLKTHKVPIKDQLQFGNQWIVDWMKEYGVSLAKPNKRYSIKAEDLKIRIEDYLKNIWYVRRFFIEKYGVDPPIINGDQMPLHRNECSEQKTLNFKNSTTYVKENYMLSRDRVTVYTQVSSSNDIKLSPEFVFKGQGKRVTVNVDESIKVQWCPSGSYRLKHMQKTIENLPNRYNPFNLKNMAIYVLDNYSVHIMPEIRRALWLRGYFLVLMGGGITGAMQVNDTHVHRPLKANYREEEMALMLVLLRDEQGKVPSPTRENMVEMLLNAWGLLNIDYESVFKSLFITSALDGSEDFLVSDRLMTLVGNSMCEYRENLLKSKVPASIQEVIRNLIPPKGVKGKNVEGSELLDYVDDPFDFDKLDEEEEQDEDDVESEGDDLEPESGVLETDAVIPVESVTTSSSNSTANKTSTSISTFANMTRDEKINKDGLFLDKLAKLLDEADTSKQFLTTLKRLKNVNNDARRHVRKRIRVSLLVEKQLMEARNESESNDESADESESNDESADESQSNDESADESERNDESVNESGRNDESADESGRNDESADESERNDESADESERNNQSADESERNDESADESERNDESADESEGNDVTAMEYESNDDQLQTGEPIDEQRGVIDPKIGEYWVIQFGSKKLLALVMNVVDEILVKYFSKKSDHFILEDKQFDVELSDLVRKAENPNILPVGRNRLYYYFDEDLS